MADSKQCDEVCGCTIPCSGGSSCRCARTSGGSSVRSPERHMTCSCGAHCSCAPCSVCEPATAEEEEECSRRNNCTCGAGCMCITCARS